MHVEDTDRVAHTLKPTGILDSVHATQLRHDIEALIKSGAHTVLVDCSDLELIDSSGLGVLVTCCQELQFVDGNLILSGLNAQDERLFAITGMDDVFTVL